MAHPSHHVGIDGDEGNEPPAQGPLGATGGAGPGHPAAQLGDQELEDGGGGRVRRDPPVPVGQQGGDRGQAGVLPDGEEDDLSHLPPRERKAVHLQCQRSRHVPVGAPGERLGDAGDPVPVEEIAAQMGAGGRGQVVGGGHVPGGGVGEVRQVLEGDRVGFPSGRFIPGGQRQGPRPPPTHRGGAHQLPADAAPGVRVGHVERQGVPVGECPPQVFGAAGPGKVEQAPEGTGHQPGGGHRQVPHLAQEGGADQGAVVGDQHLQRLGRPAAYVDDLRAHLAGDEAVAAAHAAPVRAHLLEEEVGVVDETGGHPPGEVAVVAGGHRRGAGQGGAGQRPLRGGDVQQVPVRGEHGGQVGVVGQHRAAGASTRRSDGPVVGSPAHADGRRQESGVVGDEVGRPPGRLPGPVAGRLPLRIGRVQSGQRLDAVEGEHLQPGQLHVPVGGHGEREQGHVGEGVGRPVGSGAGPQEGELVGPPRQAGGGSHGHPSGVGLRQAAVLGRERLHRRLPVVPETDAAGEAVEGEPGGPQEGGQGAPHDAQAGLYLEGPVLPLAEAHPEPGVGVVAGLDVGDAEAVALDLDGCGGTTHRQGPLHDGKAPSHRPQGQSGQVDHGPMLSMGAVGRGIVGPGPTGGNDA